MKIETQHKKNLWIAVKKSGKREPYSDKQLC